MQQQQQQARTTTKATQTPKIVASKTVQFPEVVPNVVDGEIPGTSQSTTIPKPTDVSEEEPQNEENHDGAREILDETSNENMCDKTTDNLDDTTNENLDEQIREILDDKS